MPNDKFKAMVANFGGNQEEQVEPKRRKIASVKESENLSATALLDGFSDEEDDEVETLPASPAVDRLSKIANVIQQESSLDEKQDLSVEQGTNESKVSDEQQDTIPRYDEDGDELDAKGLPILPTLPLRKPGKKSAEFIRAEQEYNRILSKREAMQDPEPSIEERKSYEKVTFDEDFNTNNVAEVILDFVCKSTIEHLKKTYTSEIYTKAYMENLFQEYIDGKTDSSNPLFKSLMGECLQKAEDDPYLKKCTKLVFKYIYGE